MHWFKTESTRNLFLIAVVIICTTAFLFYTAVRSTSIASASTAAVPAEKSGSALLSPTADFPGADVGAIADGTSPCWNPGAGTPRNVTFSVTGLSGAPTAVDVSVTFGSPAHTWMSDITSVLIAPNGASHTLFGHTGSTTATGLGDSTNLGATYVFSDNAPAPPNGGWWQTSTILGTDVAMTAGTYRTTASGGAGAVNPQPPTNMNAAFSGVSNPNGTWTLRITDSCTGDTGAVTAANLSITAAPVVPQDANVDLNGDGRTDFTVARGTNTPLADGLSVRPGRMNYASLEERPSKKVRTEIDSAVPQAPPIYWYTAFNNSAVTGVGQLGDAATDFLTPEDFDGDAKDDIAVWTPGAPNSANFKILRSTTNTIEVSIFGQDGDDPAVVGDYDGDNKADAAVFRCPALGAPAAQCFFFYRGSLNNPSGNITYVPWGFGDDGDFFPNVGDFDGDGKNDFCLQRSNPASPANGQFVLLRSSDLGSEYINWGLSTDFIIPGDYDGDGKSDFCVRRTVGSDRQHWILNRTGATSLVVWGIVGDSSTPGDYDGDGKTDLAIWRSSSTPGNSRFWIRNSSDGSVTTKIWGQCPDANSCDFPAASWAVH
ncbi:MAG TPA: VCBS repeat-containing protein [Pyrinomonadaceae bacterium]|nr:VCBS repeat-containing protein [Pyrinomonadaceae bacterium]